MSTNDERQPVGREKLRKLARAFLVRPMRNANEHVPVGFADIAAVNRARVDDVVHCAEEAR